MKTKSLVTIIFLHLINSLSIYSQNVDYKFSINDSIANTLSDTISVTKPIPANNNISEPLIYNQAFYHDTLTSTDSATIKNGRSTVIDAKVEYNSKDSTIFSLDGKKVFLFGDAKIVYKNIELTAAYIEVDMEQNIIYAEGTTDSLGAPVGQPIFKQDGDEYKSKTITYNLKTEKGYIKGLYTQQDEGYLHSQTTKKSPDNSINLNKGKYTTCELEHPHFYIFITKGKVIPDKAIVAGPSFLVIEDIPLYPLCLPFGYFPNTKEKRSGFIMPTYGDEQIRGFNLRNGGYYFALNEYADLALTGDIYSKGSYQVSARSSYKMRYKFSGSFDLGFSKIITSEKGLSDYNESNEYRVVWSHSQDAKARPNSKFSASVNFRSMNDSRYNSKTDKEYLDNTTTSSIYYNKNFANTPFIATINLKHSQNTKDSSVTLTLPQFTLQMSSITPFQRKNPVGKTRWYEKISFAYTGNFENKVKTKDSILFTNQTLSSFKNGVNHSPTVSLNLKLLNHLNMQPTVSYKERWYFSGTYRYLNDTNVATYDSAHFARIYDYGFGFGLNSTLYGMYLFKSKKIKAIRHVITPSVSFNYKPNFKDEKYGYYLPDPKTRELYSPFSNGIYGIPSGSESGAISFSLGNTLEMKVANKKDTVKNETKIKLLESFNLSTSYDLIKDSLKWSDLSISWRTTIFKGLSVNFSAAGSFYALNANGSTINVFETRMTGKPIRFTRFSASTRYSFNSKTFLKPADENQTTESEIESPIPTGPNIYAYDYFDIPWDLNLDYSFNYSKSGLKSTKTQTLSFKGNVSITKKWKINFTSGWDFEAKDFSFTRFGLVRDLHCWTASLNAVPFGPIQSYNFTIQVKSGVLQDLKYTKDKSWIDNYYNN